MYGHPGGPGAAPEALQRLNTEDGLPGGPVVGTPCFQCQGHRFDPSWGAKIPHASGTAKKKKQTLKIYPENTVL